jgi:mono/diheme cytochrome c family protein
MIVRVALAATALLLIASPALAQPAQGRAADVLRGEALTAQNCSMCHATGTSGDSPNPRAPHFRDLGKRYPVEDLSEALAEGIIVGHSPMPELRFSAADVQAIVAYLQSIQTPPQTSN